MRWLASLVALWLGLSLLAPEAHAQALRVGPYLQKVRTDGIEIRFETFGTVPSAVEWGATRQLGARATSRVVEAGRSGVLRSVELSGLAPATTYYYRVRSGDHVGRTSSFRTLPARDSDARVRMLVLSDMQRDRSRPHVFEHLLKRGVAPLLLDREERPLLALIAGDLVRHGGREREWRANFFAPLAAVAPWLPLYAVAGNHDEDSSHYFRYFALPENGSTRRPERWWWSDVGNVRLVGLDSNEHYRSDEQLSWLAGVLRESCDAAHVDFVFAALHHPEHSELWPRGELPYSGRIARMIETFSSGCGKPAVIFSGHTHAYARGHSRDHPVSYLTVASAGGKLDRAGEHPSRDYADFVRSEAAYGFVVADVQAGDRPWFRLRRVSFGSSGRIEEGSVSDELVVRRDNRPPTRPRAMWPREEVVSPLALVLTSSRFSDPDGDRHGASRWQLSDGSCDFTAPLIDRWYQLGDDRADDERGRSEGAHFLRLPELAWERTYCYRVRVRDRGLGWSEWSEPQRFRTMSAPMERVAQSEDLRAF